MSEDNLFVRLVSARDATLLTEEDLPGYKKEDENTIVASNGEALWAYRNEGKINGVVVQESDLNLAVDSDDLIQRAFRPQFIPHSVIFWMSPDETQQNADYEKLLRDVYDGRAIIRDEQKQYDNAKAKFMVWIRYDEVHYELHPRYSYLKEESK